MALKTEKNSAVVAEVKRQRKEFKPELLESKIKHLREKVMPRYKIEAICLSMDDM